MILFKIFILINVFLIFIFFYFVTLSLNIIFYVLKKLFWWLFN